jgi:acylphosphatase
VNDALERMEVRITGRVQGVGFRWWARTRADALGLTGWVMNDDEERSVSLVAEGPTHRLDLFEQQLREGPPSARVEALEARRGPASRTFARFEITRP